MDETPDFGLTPEATEWILKCIRMFPEIEEVILFGSRAMGSYKRGSDIDFALKGNFSDPDYPERLRILLEEGLYLPYFYDIIDYNKITDPNLKEHIDNVGKVFYEKAEDELL